MDMPSSRLTLIYVFAMVNCIAASYERKGNQTLAKTLHAYNETGVTWDVASSNCKQNGSSLLRIDPDEMKLIASIKRNIHISNGSEYWVAVYTSSYNEDVQGNNTRCGYLTYFKPFVSYGACDGLKGFICFNDPHIALADADDSPGGLYAGVSVGLVVFISACVGAALWWRRKKHDKESGNSLQQCGNHLVSNQESNNKATSRNHNNLETKDNTSDISDQLKDDGYCNTAHDIEQSVMSTDTLYSVVDLSLTRDNRPNSVHTTTTPNTGYLSMDGHMTGSGSAPNDDAGDNSYDFLSSVKRKDKHDDFEESGNIYGTGLQDVTDPVYDSTFQRHSSQRALISDYDHVSIESATMHNNVCNSIVRVLDKQKVSSGRKIIVENPNYDTVDIK